MLVLYLAAAGHEILVCIWEPEHDREACPVCALFETSLLILPIVVLILWTLRATVVSFDGTHPRPAADRWTPATSRGPPGTKGSRFIHDALSAREHADSLATSGIS